MAADELAHQKAVQKAKDEAQALSDELVIEQAKAMAINDNNAVRYVDRIKYVQAPDTAVLLMSGCAMVLAACQTSYVALDRQPSAALLVPCQDPELVPDPDSASSEQIKSSASTSPKPMSIASSGTMTW